ncbi:MAG: hypothetical protein ABSG18_15800 [Steroidobacteraceae bacterium]|jgi:hypothetical protein
MATALTIAVILLIGALTIWLICRPKSGVEPLNPQRNHAAAKPKTKTTKNNRQNASIEEHNPELQPPVGKERGSDKEREQCLDCIMRSVEIVGLIALIAYVVITYGLWQEAQIQTNASIDALHTSQRPWVYASRVEITHIYPVADATQPNGPFDVDLSVSLKNTGTSVATKGAAMAYLYPGFGKGGSITFASNFMSGVTHGTLVMPWGSPPSDTNEAEIWNRECAEVDKFVADSVKTQPWQTGFILVPGAESRYVATAPNGSVTQQNMSTNHFLVYGCIAYGDGFGIQHHTRFCFVGRDNPDHPTKADLMACARSEAAD